MNASERERSPADEVVVMQGQVAEELLHGPCAPAGCL